MAPKANIPCPRCPADIDADIKHHHGKQANGLIKCYGQTSIGNEYTSQHFWPGITTTRNDMGKDEQDRHDMLLAMLDRGDVDLAKDMVAELKVGRKTFQGTKFTKRLAESAVQVMKENEKAAKKGSKSGAGATTRSATNQDVKQDVKQDGDQIKTNTTDGSAGLLKQMESLTTEDELDAQGSSASNAPEKVLPSAIPPTEAASAEGGTTLRDAMADTAQPTMIAAGAADSTSPATGLLTSSPSMAAPSTSTTTRTSQAETTITSASVLTRSTLASNNNVATHQGNTSTTVMQYVDEVAGRLFQAEQDRQSAGTAAGNTAPPSRTELDDTINKYGLRTGFAANGTPQQIETNHLTMTCPSTIHVYKVEMVRERPIVNGTPTPVYVKKQADKLLVMHHLEAAQAHFVDLQNKTNDWVTDGDLIWSIVPLFHNTNALHAPPPLVGTVAQPIQYVNEMGNTLQLEDVTISWKQTIDLNQPVGQLFYDHTAATFGSSTPSILTRGLNAFFRRYVSSNHGPGHHQLTCTSSKKSFLNSSGASLDDHHNARTLLALKGYFLSVRPGVQNMFLNINSATSPFLQSMTVQDFIDRCRHVSQKRSILEICKYLKGLQVRIRYTVNNAATTFPRANSRSRFINCAGFSIRNEQRVANQTRWVGLTDVAAWYSPRSPWRGDDSYPRPPLRLADNVMAINVGKDPDNRPQETEWYPATELVIEPWQPFKGGRLLTHQVTNMIRYALQEPDAHRTMLLDPLVAGGLGHFGFAGPNAGATQAGLNNLQMTAGTQFVQIQGRLLTSPTISYSAGEFDVQDASWNLKGVRFATTSRFDVLPVLNISGGPPAANFDNTLRQQLRSHGLIAGTSGRVIHHPARPLTITDDSLSDDWHQTFYKHLTAAQQAAAKLGRQPGPVMVILPAKSQDDYACVKRAADLTAGVHTICVIGKTAGSNWRPQTVSNVALKYNLKGGRDNHHLGDNAFDLLRSGATANTIVLGADVTHPGAGAHTATPSIAAVVGSTDDHFMHFPGSMRLQKGKKEDIVELADMVKERLLDWAAKHHNNLPSNVLFYRDGVSESQYDILQRRELPSIQLGMNMAYARLHPNTPVPNATTPPLLVAPNPQAPPQDQSREEQAQFQKEQEEIVADQIENHPGNVPFHLTFIVVGKRHHTRFYTTAPTQQISSTNTNVKPGMLVDEVITHPFKMDFYLQSHLPIKGTGRSAHYIVLRNNMALSVDNLHKITHNFCYTYARATRGVSYCAPAYYADRLCDRGRCYLRHCLVRHQDYRPPPKLTNETWPAYCDRIVAFINNSSYYRPYLPGHHHKYTAPNKYGAVRKNPWHPNLDNTMFYL